MNDHIDGCECCGKWPVVLLQRCHPDTGTVARLHEDGQLVISCKECDKFIVNFQTDLLTDKRVTHESISGRDIH